MTPMRFEQAQRFIFATKKYFGVRGTLKKDLLVIDDEIYVSIDRERFASTIIDTASDKIIFYWLHSTLNDNKRVGITFKISPINFLKREGTYYLP